MSYQPSPVAAYWVSQYHGSIDNTALLLAVDAGITRGRAGQKEDALMIRAALDRWEVDGDDERLVNDVLDPWINRVLGTKRGSVRPDE